LQFSLTMRTARLNLLPALALTGLTALAGLSGACGGQDSLPTGSWHPTTTGSSGGTGGTTGSTGSTGSTGDTGSSGGGSSGSSGATGSSGSSGGDTGSSGGTASSGSGSGGTGTGTTPPTNVAVTLDQSAIQLPLMDNSAVHVSVAPNGYTGTLALATGTLPTGVTASFDNAMLTLDGTTTATATLTVTTADNAPPGDLPITVNATADGVTKSAPLDVTVQSTITLHIPAGVNNTGATVSNPNTKAFGPYPITIVAPANLSSSNPITVNFMNDDTVSHEIHADNATQGFGHDPGPFGAGQMDPYVREVNAAGTFDFYLHDQGSPITVGRIFIQTGQ
jgi:hypothetical protein